MPSFSRRAFLATGGATAVGSRATAAPVRPNIVWISCEDISPHLGCYGDPHAITPTLDGLAREGVRYTNAFTVAGVCAPSRSGIITGVHPSTLGSCHMRCQVKLPEYVKCFPEYLREAGYYCTNNSKEDYNFITPKTAWDESSAQAHWKKRPAGAPFFAVFNFTNTHESQIAKRGAEFEKMVARLKPSERQDPAKLTTLPPYYPDTPETRRDWANQYELITAMDYLAGDILREIDEAGLRESTIVFFWSDHGTGLPRAKRWLYESGTRVPLIVRIPEKLRTAGQGIPGSVNDELISFLDLAPTVLNLAGIPAPPYMHGRAFLGPGLKPPRRYVYGARDRMDERYDIIRTVRDRRYRYVRNYEFYKPYYQFISYSEEKPTMREIRRVAAEGKLPPAAQQFMALQKPPEELYDVAQDKHEIRNLAQSPAHQAVLKRLRAEHLRWAQETRDTGLIPEPLLVEEENRYGSRMAILEQPGARQRMARLREIHGLLLKGSAALGALEKAAADPDPAARYWALTGLGNLGEAAAAARPTIEQASRDASAVVRVAAARALCRLGATPEGIAAAVAEMSHPVESVRLQAMLVLDELGEKAAPARAAITAALQDPASYVQWVARHALAQLPA